MSNPEDDSKREGALRAARPSELSARGKLEHLLDAQDAPARIRRVPAEDLYFAIVEVGLSDASDVIQLASPAQFRAFVDLAGWKKDRLVPHEVLAWLAAAHGDSPEAFLEKLLGLDMEVLEEVLRTYVVVHSLEEDPDANPTRPVVETAEGKYLLEITAEGPELAMVRTILTALIAKDPFEATRLFEAVRWEVPTELEETAYRFRAARLEDLGFPPLEEAVALFAHRKVPPFQPKGDEATLARAERVDYLDAALRGLTPEERAPLEAELRWLVNSALVAEGAEPGDPHAVRAVSERARDYLLLGIEQLCGGAPTEAADVLRAHTCKEIFQVGFSLTLELKFEADRLAKAPLARVAGRWMTLDAEAAALNALRRKRPLRALKVEGADPVPFRSRRELADSRETLRRAESQVAVFRALLGGSEEAARERLARWPEDTSAERLFSAAVGHALLGHPPSTDPLPESEVAPLLASAFEGTADRPKIRDEALARARAAFPAASAGEAAEAMARFVLGKWLAELAPAFLAGRSLGRVAETVLPIVKPAT